MIRINNIKVPIDYTENIIINKISKMIGTPNFKLHKLVKKSIDARDKNSLMYILSYDITSDAEKKILAKNINNNNIMSTKYDKYHFPYKNFSSDIKEDCRPVIIGAGPAGYFCGLYLAENGYKPIIIERGKRVEDRTKDLSDFWNGGKINPNSNVSFGEGGAGTFSDGKLNTGIKDKMGRIGAVIDKFIALGADEDISYNNKPHIGTDVLKEIMTNMRNAILEAGGQIYFNSLFCDYDAEGDKYNLHIKNLDTEEIRYIKTKALVLAIGHSSRDTFRVLTEKKLPMEPKAFAMGVRIEHSQDMINKSQYGDSDMAKLLPAADYKMTYHSSSGRGVYSFCMCPGGYVVNASSDEEQAVVNGMSYHDRDGDNSNSAIVVTVTPEDFAAEGFDKYGVLAGVEYQKKYEHLAYIEGSGKLPVQTYKNYKQNIKSDKSGTITPNIKGKYVFANLNNCLPVYVNNAIIEGINYYDKKLHGFASDDAVLSGIESRTSSPVRIIRDDDFMSDMQGIFPCGEGCGYAGGITSAAVDGIKVAEAVAKYILRENI